VKNCHSLQKCWPKAKEQWQTRVTNFLINETFASHSMPLATRVLFVGFVLLICCCLMFFFYVWSFPLVVDHCVVNRNIFVDQHCKTTITVVNITTTGQMPNGQKA